MTIWRTFVLTILLIHLATSARAALGPMALSACPDKSECWEFAYRQERCQVNSSGLLSCFSGDELARDIFVPLPRQLKIGGGQLWNNDDTFFWERKLEGLSGQQRQLVSFVMSSHKILWIKNISDSDAAIVWSADGFSVGDQHYGLNGDPVKK